MKINLPNQVTLGRLFLALVFFFLLSFYDVNDLGNRQWVVETCFWIFLAAALADWLDGYLARRLKQVTAFGRIVDPVVDKVMVCGAFAFFASPHFYDVTGDTKQFNYNVTGVEVWMVIVLIIREFLVSAIRSYSESHGREFGADWSGKIKMVIQATTVCIVLGQVAWFLPGSHWPFVDGLRKVAVLLTVIVTALSIFGYIGRARKFLRMGGGPESEEAEIDRRFDPRPATTYRAADGDSSYLSNDIGGGGGVSDFSSSAAD